MRKIARLQRMLRSAAKTARTQAEARFKPDVADRRYLGTLARRNLVREFVVRTRRRELSLFEVYGLLVRTDGVYTGLPGTCLRAVTSLLNEEKIKKRQSSREELAEKARQLLLRARDLRAAEASMADFVADAVQKLLPQ